MLQDALRRSDMFRNQLLGSFIVFSILLLLTACAPAAARPPVQLQGTVQDMVTTTVTACPTITVLGYNYMNIESIGDSFVACRASATTGVAILGLFGGVTSPDLRLNVAFSVVADRVVQAYISSVPRNTDVEDQLETALRIQFSMVSLP
jgi:hypothetical protein